MSRKPTAWPAFLYLKVVVFMCVCGSALGVMSCDRGADTQIEAARKFADAVARNDTTTRDTMIATYKYREYFENPFVASEMLSWFRTFYDFRDRRFIVPPGADVDRDLKPQLQGGLLDTSQILETGMVKVRSPNTGEDGAYFWMVHQDGKPWKVAMVTKGEMQVNFR